VSVSEGGIGVPVPAKEEEIGFGGIGWCKVGKGKDDTTGDGGTDLEAVAKDRGQGCWCWDSDFG